LNRILIWQKDITRERERERSRVVVVVVVVGLCKVLSTCVPCKFCCFILFCFVLFFHLTVVVTSYLESVSSVRNNAKQCECFSSLYMIQNMCCLCKEWQVIERETERQRERGVYCKWMSEWVNEVSEGEVIWIQFRLKQIGTTTTHKQVM